MQFWLSFYKQLNYLFCHSWSMRVKREDVWTEWRKGNQLFHFKLYVKHIHAHTLTWCCAHKFRLHKQFIDVFKSEYVENLLYMNAHLWLLLVSDFCIIFEVFDVLLQSSCMCSMRITQAQ